MLQGSGVRRINEVRRAVVTRLRMLRFHLVRAYSTSVSEAVAAAPIAYLVERDVLQTCLNPADAGRIEAELRARGASILDATWTQEVTLTIGIDPAQRDAFDACLAQASSGVAKFRYVETRRVELDEAPSGG